MEMLGGGGISGEEISAGPPGRSVICRVGEMRQGGEGTWRGVARTEVGVELMGRR